MSDMETRLHEARRTAPSPDHQKRMRDLFDEAALRRPPVWRRPMAVWQCAALCALCLAMGFLLKAQFATDAPREATRTTVYVLDSGGEDFRRAFDVNPDPMGGLSPDSLWVSLQTSAPGGSI